MNSKLLAEVLVVDDSPDIRGLIGDLLASDYNLSFAENGSQAIDLVKNNRQFDLILLDVIMDDMDGYSVLRQFQTFPHMKDVPVIFLTSMSSTFNETQGLRLGAIDYIHKPVKGEVLCARVRNHVELKRTKESLNFLNRCLEEKVVERTEEVEIVQDATILALAALAEIRDPETGSHIMRTKLYVKQLAELLQKTECYQSYLTDHRINLIFKSAPLHDIGKVGVPDDILLKEGPLDELEWVTMEKHVTYGFEALCKAEMACSGHQIEFLDVAKDIVLGHHEKWDGSGYPNGLSGQDIPIPARFMAVADVYDALITKRCYKPAFSHEKSVKIIAEGAGVHFDPVVVSAFLENDLLFDAIAKEYPDED